MVTKKNCQKWSYGRSQEFHDSTEPLTSVISGENDKMRVELEKNRIRKIIPKLFRPRIYGPNPIGPGPDQDRKKIKKSRTSSKPGTEADHDRDKFQATVMLVTL